MRSGEEGTDQRGPDADCMMENPLLTLPLKSLVTRFVKYIFLWECN